MPGTAAPGPLAEPARLARAVARWFRRGHRRLPWRTSPPNPYRIWIAEVLLQQTRVAQAVPYFERFVRRFPSVQALARARQDEVLKLWQGAGYYARARRLHTAARLVLGRYRGQLPRSVEELERLPGVGPYTARAIACLAYGARVMPADANVFRVAARWFREEGDVRSPEVRASLVATLEQALPSRDPTAFAEGMMELGETVCLPRAPRCDACPAAFGCRAANELDDPGTLPRPSARPARPHVRAAVVALARGGRWLVQRRPSSGLLGGLWEFPGGQVEPGESPRAAARRELREETGALAGRLQRVGTVRHAYSHFTVELHVFRGNVRRPPAPAQGRRWARLNEALRLPLPRATEKIIDLLQAQKGVPARAS